MHSAARCGWALGAPSRQFKSWGPLLLTQPHGAHIRTLQRFKPARQLHTTLAVRQQQSQQQLLDKQQLTWQDLHRAAQIAAWSGLCYLTPDDLQSTISRQHQGLTLVASGRNGYTAWFVADGVVPAAHFCSKISSRNSNGGSPSNSGNYNAAPTNHTSNGSNGHSAADTSAAGGAVGSVCARVPQGTRERFVFFRGVQWSAPDINNSQLSQALMNLWPTPFPKATTGSSSSNGGNGAGQQGSAGSSPLVAHAGIAGIAQELFTQLRPYMQQADDVGMPLCFAGHSLGGSLAMLMLVLHQMHRKDRQQRPWPTCYTFGSPPVLAHERGGGGGPVLQALALPPDAVSSFVLEMDPVPRALLSVDPTFQALSGWSAVKGLLQLRELFVGSGSPLSPGRFLFEAVGQVHLIKWTPEGGSRVVPLDATEIEQELSYFTTAKSPGSNGSNGGGQQQQQPPAATAAAATPGMQLEQQFEKQVQEGPVAAAAPAAAVGGAAAALMNSLRAWLDHHHRSYAQELEAAALREVREQLAAEQQQQTTVPQPPQQRQQQQGQGQEPQNVLQGAHQHSV